MAAAAVLCHCCVSLEYLGVLGWNARRPPALKTGNSHPFVQAGSRRARVFWGDSGFGCALALEQVQRHVNNHVFLVADHAAPAQLDRNVHGLPEPMMATAMP